ncbi:MAG: TlpA disulfide reductase family protein [Chloroflexi bacterium]|nr:TlpA disulfide reductase family protein [Chloroflexota bacterium]
MRRMLLFAGIALLLGACSSVNLGSPGAAKGAQAPNFELEKPDGQFIALDEFRGEVVLLNFWATWCGPCRLEMPAIQQRYEQADFQVLAVNFDETADQVRAFMEELELTFPALLDPGGEIQRLYEVRGYPTSVFVDEKGIIQIIHIGLLSEDQLDGYLVEMGVLN